jgi:hypothetical protein
MTPNFERIQRQVDVLRRHYEATSNPLFIWGAIKLLLTRRDAPPLPRWVSDYLQTAAYALIGLGEGIDRNDMPAPPKEDSTTTDADRLAYSEAAREYEARVTVNDTKVVEQAMRVLGFVTRQNHNVFREYRTALQEQGYAEIAAVRWTTYLHECLRAGTRATQTGFVASEAAAAGCEPRAIEKRLEKARKSLKRGKLELDPRGPEASRRRKTTHPIRP